jgi:hypothetical protein
VNAVYPMMEHISGQMDTTRCAPRSKDSGRKDEQGAHSGTVARRLLDRMFWAEVREAGKGSALPSNEAACVPPRNGRQFVELLLERGDKEIAGSILLTHVSGFDAKDPEPRRKTAIGLTQLADFGAEGSRCPSGESP